MSMTSNFAKLFQYKICKSISLFCILSKFYNQYKLFSHVFGINYTDLKKLKKIIFKFKLQRISFVFSVIIIQENGILKTRSLVFISNDCNYVEYSNEVVKVLSDYILWLKLFRIIKMQIRSQQAAASQAKFLPVT